MSWAYTQVCVGGRVGRDGVEGATRSKGDGVKGHSKGDGGKGTGRDGGAEATRSKGGGGKGSTQGNEKMRTRAAIEYSV